MFLLRMTGWLLSLPLLWAGQLAAALKMPLSVPLLKAAWQVGGDGNVALLALANLQRHGGAEAARLQATAWLAERPRPELAAFAGLLAVQAGDLEGAGALLSRGLELGSDRGGMLELLELLIAGHFRSANVLWEVARRLERRRDLSPAVSKFVLRELLGQALFCSRFDEALQRAKHLWSIDEDPLAATTFWAVARHHGEPASFETYFARLRVPPAQRLYLQVLGCLSLGELDEARRLLALLGQTDPGLAETAQALLLSKEAAA
jgi:hypothetical protein